MRVEDLRRLLQTYGVRASKARGQCFLLDESVLDRQVAAAALRPSDRVLEIGPGIGNLTERLLRSGAQVVAIEQDPRLCRLLRERFEDSLELIEGDAVQVPLPEFAKVVANLPYQISSGITFRLLERGFDRAVLLYQREFADRLLAGPGSKTYGRLSVSAYCRAERERLADVPAGAFWPPPKVSASLVRLRPRPRPFAVRDPELFERLVEAAFLHRRKTLLNSLRLEGEWLGLPRSALKELAQRSALLEARPEALSPEQLGALSDLLAEARPRSGSAV